MKRQMKMTTTQKPQKKRVGGAIRKAAGAIKPPTTIADFTRLAGDASEKIKADQTAKRKFKALAPELPSRIAQPKVPSRPSSLKPVGLFMKSRPIKASGMKKGGSVMSDKMGRAMKKKTADARGRAMKGK